MIGLGLGLRIEGGSARRAWCAAPLRAQQASGPGRSSARRAAPAVAWEGGVRICSPSEPVISDFHTVKWAVRRLNARVVHGAPHLSARSRRRGRVDRRRGRRRLRWQRPGAARQLLRQWAECEVLSRLTFREHNLLPELIVQGQSLFDPGSSLVASGEIVTKLTSLHPSQVISAGLLHELQPGYWRVSHGNQRHSGSTVRSREAVSAKRAKRATPTLTLPSARWRAPC
jgi:hypothetical protein